MRLYRLYMLCLILFFSISITSCDFFRTIAPVLTTTVMGADSLEELSINAPPKEFDLYDEIWPLTRITLRYKFLAHTGSTYKIIIEPKDQENFSHSGKILEIFVVEKDEIGLIQNKVKSDPSDMSKFLSEFKRRHPYKATKDGMVYLAIHAGSPLEKLVSGESKGGRVTITIQINSI